MRAHRRTYILALVLVGCAAGNPATSTRREALDAGAPHAELDGVVVDAEGRPVAGAMVSVWAHFDMLTPDPALDALSDERGRFRFDSLPASRWAVTATFPGEAAAYSGVRTTPSQGVAVHVTLRLGGPAETVAGAIRDDRGAPVEGARVIAATFSENEDEVYVTRSDPGGHYALALPGQSEHLIVVDAPPRPRASLRVAGSSTSADVSLSAPPAPRPGDDALRAWLRAGATALAPSGDGLDDAGARALESIAGDASVVAIGEATHGSAEFPEWRRRFFASLARDRGFTVYAMEAPPAIALDEYVVHGTGDAVQAIHALAGWPTDTTETLAFVRWMRAYDADPKHGKKLRVEGFDVYTPPVVVALLAYLGKVEPSAVADARRTLAPFERSDCDSTYPALASEAQQRVRGAVDALLGRFDAHRAAYVARSSPAEWARARQLVRIVQEAESSYRDESLRDRFMAENVRWLLDQYPPGTRFVLYAHDDHIAAEKHGLSELGALLRQGLGDRYVCIGFSFGEGSFRALDWRNGRSPTAPLGVFGVGRPPRDTLDAAFALAGLSAFVVDLRAVEGPVAEWLRSPQRMHTVRGWFAGDEAAFETFAPVKAFDAVVYLDRISPSHALAASDAR